MIASDKASKQMKSHYVDIMGILKAIEESINQERGIFANSMT